MKSKKGFTLIELLAVIVILGLLLTIAIPSVSKYINQSKKKTLIINIENYIKSVIVSVNNMEYSFTDSNKIYAIPIECVLLERGGENPFGEWLQAEDAYFSYVLVQYNNKDSSYIYGFTFKDSAGYVLLPISQEKIDKDGSQLKRELDFKMPVDGNVTESTTIDVWRESGFIVNENTTLEVLVATSEGEEGNLEEGTCTLLQKGSNYEEIEKVKNKKFEFGQLVCFGDECFNVIDSDMRTVTMLAVHKINPDVDNPIQNANAELSAYSTRPYWYNGRTVKDEYGGKYPAYIYDSNSILYNYLEAYANYLKEKNNFKDIDIKLIKYEDVLEFPSKTILKKGYSLWTGSASMGNNQYIINSGGGFGGAGWCSQKHGIVPVIVVNKADINI